MKYFHFIPVSITALAVLLVLSPREVLTQQRTSSVAPLPDPTGPFAVGRSEFHWIDSTRTEPFAPLSDSRRELIVYVWYPAERLSNTPPAAYIPHFAVIAAAIGDSGVAAEFGSARTAIESGTVLSHSMADAPVKSAGGPFPVLAFSHGFGESSLTYSTQLEDLASHGYFVFGIEHPYDAYAVALNPTHVVHFAKAAWDSARSRPNGAVAYQLAQVPLRAADIRFVLDQIWRIRDLPGGERFASALDLGRVGVFGHSLGGIAAASVCRFDARIRACINEDADDNGRPFDGGAAAFPIKKPFLFFATGHSIYVSPRTSPPTEADLINMKLTKAQYDSITTLYQLNQDLALKSFLAGAVRVMAEAPDFTHRTFIDLKLLQATDTIAMRHQTDYLKLIRMYILAFFDKTLRGEFRPQLDREGTVDSLFTIEHFKKK